MKHLKLFKTSKDLQDFKDGKDYITPYLYYQEQSNEIGVNQESIPNNEIWYTYRKSVFINNSGGGGEEEHALEAIQPKSKRILGNSEEHTYIPQGPLTFNPNAFNANIVSDDFIDGHGVITFDDDVTIVGDYAFYNCNDLLSITLPQTVTEIGEYAFAYSHSLTNVVIPNLVTNIGNYAFDSCDGLTGVTIPDSVTNIGNYAFYNCDGLTSITIPDSVTYIGNSAFRDCQRLTTVEIGSGCTSISTYTFQYCSNLTGITIPDSITSIGNYAFYNCSNLTTVEIGSGCTSIGNNAFYNCDGLTSITIPDSVTSIGTYAFYGCDGLTTVEIGNGCTSIRARAFEVCSSLMTVKIGNGRISIGDYAFQLCSGLTTVEIGSGCTSIGNSAFQSCSNLKEITCHAITAPSIGKRTFKDVAYYGLLIHPDGSDYSSWLSASTYYLGYYSWGTGFGKIKCTYDITSIDGPAKICNSIASIYKMEVDGVEINPTSAYTFNETGEHVVEFTSLNNITSSIFYNCSSLTSVEIGSGITSIRNSAFYNCSNLKEITCHAITAPSINSNTFKGIASYGLLIYPEGSDYSSWLSTDSYYLGYYNWGNKVAGVICTYNITSTNTPTNICKSTNGIYKMEVDGIEIEPTTAYTFNEIGEHIIEFTFLNNIASNAFYYCSNLTTVEIGSECTSIGYSAFRGCSSLTGVTIPNSVTSIGDYAFTSCSNLTGITIPDSITSIGSCAFEVCYNLTSIIVSSGNTIYDSRENCNAIIETATNTLIQGCYTTIIPDSVTSIGNYAFSYCYNLTGITIPDSITSIGNDAFYNCDGLTGITIPDSVTNIGNYAFYNCDNLTTVEIGSGCTSINEGAFQSSSITGLTIPDSITSIGSSAFQNCSGLTTVEIGSGVTSMGSSTFNSCSNLTGITIPDSVTSIGTSAFTNCYKLTTVEIGSGCTSIGAYAFYNCDGLTSITIPDSVTYIGNSAFRDCQRLTTVEIGSGCTSISTYTFQYCRNLTGITIPDSVTIISSYAFYYCDKLTTIEIGSGCTNINSYAFQNCSSLKEITCHANTAPYVQSNTFRDIARYGLLIHPEGSDYSSWLSTSNSYLGYYNWGNKVAEVVCTYDITSIDGPAKICKSTYGIYKMEVDGVEIKPTSAYTFNETGEHIIEFSFLNEIPSSAFYECSSLTNVEIGSGCTSIGDYAFYYCDKLTTIEIGSGCTTIGSQAFVGCSSLKKITCHAITAPSINSNTFKYIASYGLLTHPEGSDYSNWLSTDSYYLGYYNWGDKVCKIKNTYNITSTNTSTKICNSTNSIVGIKINNIDIPISTGYTFNEIGEHIIEFTFLNNIAPSTFFRCSSLINVEIGSGCTGIGGSAFYECSSLTGITMPNSVTSIGGSAFQSCSSLTGITIPDSVTSIGNYAFQSCSHLTSIIVSSANTVYDSREDCNAIIETATNTLIQGSNTTIIPNSVVSIGNSAFQGCSILTGITIPDSVTSIGNNAFSYCLSLTNVEIGSGCTSIGNEAFYWCSSLKEITCHANTAPSISSNTFYNIAYYGLLTHPEGSDYSSWLSTSSYYLGYNSWISHQIGVELPELTLDTYDLALLVYAASSSVTKICSATTNISEIKVNEEVLSSVSTGYTFSQPYTWNVVRYKFKDNTTISANTFIGITQGCDVNISDTVTTIGNNAFKSCSKLKSINLSENLTTIGASAFTYCSKVSELILPDTLSTIGNNSFYNCSSLTGVVIPNSVTSIGSRAFNNCTKLETIIVSSANTVYDSRENCNAIIETATNTLIQGCNTTIIPDSVTSIGAYAFYNCDGLTGVTIPDSVTNIGNYAFYDCDGLTINVVIPNSVTNIGSYAFQSSSITGLTIMDAITPIGQYAFESCSKLKEVNLGNNVTSIGSYAFYGSMEFSDLIIPDSVKSIGTYAFYCCSKLSNLHIGSGITSIPAYAFASIIVKNLVIPDTVKTIGQMAFDYCSSMETLHIGSGVTTISNTAFSNCQGIKELYIPASVTRIDSSAFQNCTKLETIVVSSANTVYDSRENCNAIIETATNTLIQGCNTTIIPDSVTSIGAYAFYNCTNLTGLTFSSAITSIESNAFYNCDGLTEIVIPNSVKTIGSSAFDDCTNITLLEIGENVTTIGSKAFNRCSKLKQIISHAVIAPSISNQVFYSVANNGQLYYPQGGDYSNWLSTNSYYLGYYGWTGDTLYKPETYYDLEITAEDVDGRATTTIITWRCLSDGIDTLTNEIITGVELTGTAISNTFEQNTSETDVIERTITFEYMGLTASTVITQGVWINQYYALDLNSQWQSSTITNPDSTIYDGVYESFSNKGKDNTAAIMYIDIVGYESFSLYIRSYAESNYDYVMVSQLDQTINNSSSYSNSTLVKAHTRGNQQSGTALSNYKLVEFTGIDGGEHRITVVYRKDGSSASGDDRGYILIPKNQ